MGVWVSVRGPARAPLPPAWPWIRAKGTAPAHPAGLHALGVGTEAGAAPRQLRARPVPGRGSAQQHTRLHTRAHPHNARVPYLGWAGPVGRDGNGRFPKCSVSEWGASEWAQWAQRLWWFGGWCAGIRSRRGWVVRVPPCAHTAAALAAGSRAPGHAHERLHLQVARQPQSRCSIQLHQHQRQQQLQEALCGGQPSRTHARTDQAECTPAQDAGMSRASGACSVGRGGMGPRRPCSGVYQAHINIAGTHGVQGLLSGSGSARLCVRGGCVGDGGCASPRACVQARAALGGTTTLIPGLEANWWSSAG